MLLSSEKYRGTHGNLRLGRACKTNGGNARRTKNSPALAVGSVKKEDFALLRESLEQAVAFKQGDKTAARVKTIEKPDDAIIEEYRSRLEEAKEIIIDLINQFAYTGQKDGRAMIWTGGLSALESGFSFVGWDDPHFTPELECDYEGCYELATSGTPTPTGYKWLCSKHYQELKAEQN